MATQEFPSPSRSASGQLNANAGGRARGPGGNQSPPQQQPSLFATRPLPESPAAAYARSTEQKQPAPPPPDYATVQQTQAYGVQPAYAVSPPAPSKTAKAAATTGKATATGAKPRKTVPVSVPAPQPAAAPGQTSNWQASLPVSPWSTYERQAGPVSGLETETVLRSDLKSLKRSRTRARMYLGVVVVVAAIVIHFGLRTMEQNANSYRQLSESHAALKAQLSGAAGAVDLARARPGAPAAQAAAAVAVSGPPSTSARTLADDLKRQLVGDAAITVEARGDRVVVSMADTSLFVGNVTNVGQAGFRVLYRFGKSLKNVQDRRIVVSVLSNQNRPRAWIISAARGVSLGRFLLDDLSIDSSRVAVNAPAPLADGKTDRIEFWLEPGGATRS